MIKTPEELEIDINKESDTLTTIKNSLKDKVSNFDTHIINANCHTEIFEYYTIDRNINLLSELNSEYEIVNPIISSIESKYYEMSDRFETLKSDIDHLNTLVYKY